MYYIKGRKQECQRFDFQSVGSRIGTFLARCRNFFGLLGASIGTFLASCDFYRNFFGLKNRIGTFLAWSIIPPEIAPAGPSGHNRNFFGSKRENESELFWLERAENRVTRDSGHNRNFFGSKKQGYIYNTPLITGFPAIPVLSETPEICLAEGYKSVIGTFLACSGPAGKATGVYNTPLKSGPEGLQRTIGTFLA